jgi:hypothetical protein
LSVEETLKDIEMGWAIDTVPENEMCSDRKK